ncbi:DUF6262 family protein [Ornithinicoccus hortensis]|uniref:DUF6262 family protein n=1 Tax=Ornithinicoccus hortensis TaxID=82346 RepID=UPI00114F400E|nr:DUF6262 family protein [Ornithinicoccus hortensis]
MTTTEVLNTVEGACADLARDGEPITFTQVAATTGLARSTLYRNAALRAVIEHHQHHTDGPLSPLTDQLATLRVAVLARM